MQKIKIGDETYKVHLSNITEINTRDQLNSVRSQHPTALFFTKHRKLTNINDAYALIDAQQSVFFSITILMVKSSGNRFVDYFSSVFKALRGHYV